MRFRILGPLEVQTEQGWTSIGASKWRAALACLLLNAGQIVSTDTLIDELWGDAPPVRASNLVSIYVLRLRRLIGDTEGQVLVTRAPGYQLRLGDDDIDEQQFGKLMSQGREALTAGDPKRAAEVLADSLSLWRPTSRRPRSSRPRPDDWMSFAWRPPNCGSRLTWRAAGTGS
jgi:DNA-binding SARP family transcriptional activator